MALAGGKPTLKVGKATYKAVLVPAMRTIRSTTLLLLARFRDAGGLVVFAGEAAPLVDALPSPAATEFAATCVRVAPTGKAMADAVEAVCRRIRVVGPDGQSIKRATSFARTSRRFTCSCAIPATCRIPG